MYIYYILYVYPIWGDFVRVWGMALGEKVASAHTPITIQNIFKKDSWLSVMILMNHYILFSFFALRSKNYGCQGLHKFLNQRNFIRSRCCKLVWCRLNQSRGINIPRSQGSFSPAFASILPLCFCR